MAVARGVHVEAGDNGSRRPGENQRIRQSLAGEELVHTCEVNRLLARIDGILASREGVGVGGVAGTCSYPDVLDACGAVELKISTSY